MKRNKFVCVAVVCVSLGAFSVAGCYSQDDDVHAFVSKPAANTPLDPARQTIKEGELTVDTRTQYYRSSKIDGKSKSADTAFGGRSGLYSEGTGTSPASSLASGAAPEDLPSPRRRMIIRDATLRLRADAPAKIISRSVQIAEEAEGFVVNSSSNGVGEEVSEVFLVMRVPAPQFELVIEKLKGLGTPLHESITGQDVTEEFTDIEARLRAQRELEGNFLKILERAQNVDEILQVETELSRVRTEIERLEGRSRFLQDQAALSTIQLTVTAPYQPYEESAESFSSRLGRSFGEAGRLFVQTIADMVEFIGRILPLGIFGLPLLLWGRSYLRRRAARKSAAG